MSANGSIIAPNAPAGIFDAAPINSVYVPMTPRPTAEPTRDVLLRGRNAISPKPAEPMPRTSQMRWTASSSSACKVMGNWPRAWSVRSQPPSPRELDAPTRFSPRSFHVVRPAFTCSAPASTQKDPALRRKKPLRIESMPSTPPTTHSSMFATKSSVVHKSGVRAASATKAPTANQRVERVQRTVVGRASEADMSSSSRG